MKVELSFQSRFSFYEHDRRKSFLQEIYITSSSSSSLLLIIIYTLSEFYYSFPQILHFAPNFPVYLNVYSNYTHPPPLNSRTSTSIVKPRFPRHSRPIILAPKLSSSPVFEINLDSHYSHPFSPPNSSTFRIPRVVSKRRKQAGNERRDWTSFRKPWRRHRIPSYANRWREGVVKPRTDCRLTAHEELSAAVHGDRRPPRLAG